MYPTYMMSCVMYGSTGIELHYIAHNVTRAGPLKMLECCRERLLKAESSILGMPPDLFLVSAGAPAGHAELSLN